MRYSNLSRRRFIAHTFAAGTLPCLATGTEQQDICVYGGTASGVMAAVTAVKQGCTAVIVEPSRWLGGMTGGGLSHVDWGREKAVGGTALSILSNNYDDAKYREVFVELVKKYRVAACASLHTGARRDEGFLINWPQSQTQTLQTLQAHESRVFRCLD